MCPLFVFFNLYITLKLLRVIKVVDSEMHSDSEKNTECVHSSVNQASWVTYNNYNLVKKTKLGTTHKIHCIHKASNGNLCVRKNFLLYVYMHGMSYVCVRVCMNWFIKFIKKVLSTRQFSNKVPGCNRMYQTIRHWRDGRRGKVGLKGISEGHRGPLNQNKGYWCFP